MSNLRFLISFLFVFTLCQSATAEYAELRQEKNQFNKMQNGAGIVQPVGTTGNQFKAAIFFASPAGGKKAGVAGLLEPQAAGSYKLQHTRVGIAYYGRSFQYQFGSVISPPNKDVDGNDLVSGVSPLDYWKAEPHNAYKAELSTNAEYGRFYWSASAEKVYATRPGPADIVWVKKMPVATGENPTVTGTGWTAEKISDSLKLHSKTVSSKVTEMWREENAVFYAAATHRVNISGTPVKPPRKIYWSGPNYAGVPVAIPDSRISNVKVIYNDSFPEKVAPKDGTNMFEGGVELSNGADSAEAVDVRTLWYSTVQKSLLAKNKEGRVFMDLLGSTIPGTQIHQSLGFEIVDVIKRPNLEKQRVELGDEFPVLQPVAEVGKGVNLNLFPVVANFPNGNEFIYQHYGMSKNQRATYYAVRKTLNQNDLILWWMVEGLQGIKWPERYVRYALDWPSEPERFTHYLRPAVDSEEAAAESSVALPGANSPSIVFQDDEGKPRAKIRGQGSFFTWLTTDYPVHRTLLQFTAGDFVRFERVFSWLDTNVQNDKFPNNPITESLGISDEYGNLTKQLFSDPDSDGTGQISFPDSLKSPKAINETVFVGERIPIPANEQGSESGGEYLAGYITKGTHYSPDAYVDPLADGFTEANRGAIIPVNSIPGDNLLEVLWFRKNKEQWIKDDPETLKNEITEAQLVRDQQGFEDIYWPSVVGTYTVKWPHEVPNYEPVSKGSAIVMASNDGSGPLNSLQAKGSVYFQNDATLPGYNPNEEHAMMQGGQLYALRNDLNLTPSTSVTKISDETYSSEPYVLLSYTGSDDRPAMRAFRVMQELGEDTFDYTVEAGTILQAPMPLPLMQKLKNNKEFSGNSISEAVLKDGEDDVLKITTTEATKLEKGEVVMLTSFNEQGNNGWAYVDEVESNDIIEVLKISEKTILSIKSVEFGEKNLISKNATFKNGVYQLSVNKSGGYIYTKGTTDQSVTIIPGSQGFNEILKKDGSFEAKKDFVNINAANNGKFNENVDAVIRNEKSIADEIATITTTKPHGLESSGISRIIIRDLVGYNREYEFQSVLENSFTIKIPAGLKRKGLGGKVLQLTDSKYLESAIDKENPPKVMLQKPTDTGDYKKTTMMDRKNNLWVYRGPQGENDDANFSISFYYTTLEGFWFPESAGNNQPVVGSTVPYLFRNENDKTAKAISYKAVWPTSVPELRPGQTLTAPVFGLPAVRGNTSLKILYQQAKANSTASLKNTSVTLHDPTREKVYDMATGDAKLVELPASVVTMNHKGKTYFTRLPPHLVDRFFFDPMRGKKGQLVFKGEFVDEIVGEDYLLLNVLSGKDLDDLKKLADPNMGNAKWNDAIEGLTAKVETFVESGNKFGVFVADAAKTVNVTASNLVEITSDETAVDSYALSANGNQAGYVTLIAGDGQAFTPKAEPVQMHVIKVGGSLYRGEAKVILSDNPLAEKVTFMHTGDLAGSTDKFDYDWRIAAPEDGLPPAVSERNPIAGATATISTTGWKHLRQIPTAGVPATSDTRWVAAGLGTVTVQESSTVSAIRFVTDANESPADADQLDTIEVTTSGTHAFKVGDVVNLAGFIPTTVNVEGLTVKAVNKNILELAKGTVSGLPVAQTFGTVEESMDGVTASSPGSVLAGEFQVPTGKVPTDVYLSMTADPNLGVRVKVGSAVVAVKNVSTIAEGDADSTVSSAPSSFQPLSLVYAVDTSLLSTSGVNKITVELWSDAKPGASLSFDLKIEANEMADMVSVDGSKWLARKNGKDLRSIIIGESADVQALSDNYLVMRYRSSEDSHVTWKDTDGDESTNEGWSPWTEPQLAEGWIKRVLAGINPFNQRTKDLYSNSIDSSSSMLTQAGKRWEGDVALNMENINDYGLIEIYETVMGRGRMLSIDAGIDYGPANDALLLAAGYINDLYMILGNESWADAANPTIGIGTTDGTYGDIATALFAFKGQVPSLLEEELALLRGRDDFLQPGVETGPVYNRLFWNYTRGIDSGEVIYAINYNIQEDNDSGFDGNVGAEDAYKMYPQGHGDGYGHYLTALKGYYKLLVDNDFTWVPRTEAVTILGKPVQVDYTDERKFAAAAVALARTGKQVVDLTWRQNYNSDNKIDWDKELSPTRDNNRRNQSTTRYWGMDHWASRTGQGALINWVVGNSMLPEIDPDPTHEGIQRIDRTTVPELRELSETITELQLTLDNAEANLNPLGLSEGSVALDIDPNSESTHFEQIYERATIALGNAATAFDSTKGMTQLMRSEEDSLVGLQTSVDEQELAYKYDLIDLYGTPYPDDIGPGKTYKQGYDGPDLYHYMYVDDLGLDSSFNIEGEFQSREMNKLQTFKVDLQTNPIRMNDYAEIKKHIESSVGLKAIPQLFDPNQSDSLSEKAQNIFTQAGEDQVRFTMVKKNLEWENYDEGDEGRKYVEYTLTESGFMGKDPSWSGKRSSPGEIQTAIQEVEIARFKLAETLSAHKGIKYSLDREIEVFESNVSNYDVISQLELLKGALDVIKLAISEKTDALWKVYDFAKDITIETAKEATEKAPPKVTIAGTAVGGDFFTGLSVAAEIGAAALNAPLWSTAMTADTFNSVLDVLNAITAAGIDVFIGMEDRELAVKELVLQLDLKLKELNISIYTINEAQMALGHAKMQYQTLVAKGLRVQDEREIFRQRSSALVQGFRTRDAAFRVFRNEKLERYKALQDMASKYAFLAAQAYDYETGLLGTDEGREFINRIVNSRALGVVTDGEPEFAGSDMGDPGISSVLAEMKNDWNTLKGRLGFNNPDQYATSLSLRDEKYRILPGKEGASQWSDVLEGARKQNIMDDADVRRHCMQVGFEDGRPVPGLVVEFSTTITKGENIFGLPLAGGDNQFSSSSFATKIWSAGIGFEGYVGMSTPNTNQWISSDDGKTWTEEVSPSNPTPIWLDPKALSKNPYVYLIPVGKDFMRSPPLGDTSQIRSWTVQDVAIPLPFNIGSSEHSSKKLWQSSASLTEDLFAIRKHQPFRALDSFDEVTPNISIWKTDGYDGSATSRRLIGRSVWNSKWKLVIPGYTLLNDSEEGLDRFIQTVEDIKVHFNTYSYSGN
jgi:hypothetical protein